MQMEILYEKTEEHTQAAEKTKKKIVHINLTHGGGGVDVYTRAIINATNDMYENAIICAPEYPVRWLQDGVAHYILDVPREISVKQDILAAKQIRRILKKEKPGIVYCHSSMAGAVGRIAAWGLGCKVIYNPHSWAFNMDVSAKKKAVYVWIERLLALCTDRIVAISQSEKSAALQYKVCKENKICLIYNGVDINACTQGIKTRGELGYGEDAFIVACCGRLSEQKDPVLFADVAGVIAAKCPGVKFIWVGDGELREEFVAALKRNGVFEKIWLPGTVDKPWPIMGVADVAVLLSKWEGFSLALIEYFAMGKPVVATDVGAAAEIVADGVNGTLITERSPEKIAEAILSYSHKENAKELYDICMKTAQKFSIAKTVEATKQLYSALLLK